MGFISYAFLIAGLGLLTFIFTNVYLRITYFLTAIFDEWMESRNYFFKLIAFFSSFIIGVLFIAIWLNSTSFTIYAAGYHTDGLFWKIIYSAAGIVILMIAAIQNAFQVERLEGDNRERHSISSVIVIINGWTIILSGVVFFAFPSLIVPIFKILIELWF